MGARMANAQDGRSTYHVFPQFADGSDPTSGATFKSAIYIQNVAPASTTPNVCTLTLESEVQFSYPRGTVTRLAREHSLRLPSDTWIILASQGTQPLRNGYAVLSCTGAVTSYINYSMFLPLESSGRKVKAGETTVFSAPPGRSLQLFNDGRDGSRMGIAIANDTKSEATVQVLLGNVDGQTVSTAALKIKAKGSFAGFLDEMLPEMPAAHVGQVILNSSQSISVQGLRFTSVGFTTIPSTVRLP
jgi:hypothetical protein